MDTWILDVVAKPLFDLRLNLRQGQASDVQIAVETEIDRTVRANQLLSDQRLCRQGVKPFDVDDIRWLDDVFRPGNFI